MTEPVAPTPQPVPPPDAPAAPVLPPPPNSEPAEQPQLTPADGELEVPAASSTTPVAEPEPEPRESRDLVAGDDAPDSPADPAERRDLGLYELPAGTPDWHRRLVDDLDARLLRLEK